MIMCNRRSFIGHLEADHILLARGDTASRFVGVQLAAEPIVANPFHLTRLLLLAHLGKSFGSAKTRISAPLLDKNFCIMLVNLTPLCLAIRSVFAAMKGAFVRRDAQPVQTAYNFFFRAGHESLAIRIFKTQNKLPTRLASKQIIEKSSTCTTEMETSSWRGCHTRPCRFDVQNESPK